MKVLLSTSDPLYVECRDQTRQQGDVVVLREQVFDVALRVQQQSSVWAHRSPGVLRVAVIRSGVGGWLVVFHLEGPALSVAQASSPCRLSVGLRLLRWCF